VRPDRARRARNRVRKRLRVVLPQPVVEEMARSAVEGLRRRAAAARRRAVPVPGDAAAALACTRPEPLDREQTARIAYPFGLSGRVHGGPMDRAYGRVHGAPMRHPPLDLRSTVLSGGFV
jgi:hypothetical protein